MIREAVATHQAKTVEVFCTRSTSAKMFTIITINSALGAAARPKLTQLARTIAQMTYPPNTCPTRSASPSRTIQKEGAVPASPLTAAAVLSRWRRYSRRFRSTSCGRWRRVQARPPRSTTERRQGSKKWRLDRASSLHACPRLPSTPHPNSMRTTNSSVTSSSRCSSCRM